jgi:hypothetical protein
MLYSIDRAPNGPEGTPFAPILGLLDFFFGIVFGLFFAAIGGVVGAVVGAGLAAMSRDEPSVENERHVQDSLQREPSAPSISSDSNESLKSELTRLKERIAEIEGRERDH